MDDMYLDFSVTFAAQFVRSVVMAFSEGNTDLTVLRWQKLKAANKTNDTDIHTLNFVGDPILDIFEPTQKEKEAAIKAAELAAASGQTLPKAPHVKSVFVRLELQFKTRQPHFTPDYLKQLTQQLIENQWAKKTLWVNPACFTGAEEFCYVAGE